MHSSNHWSIKVPLVFGFKTSTCTASSAFLLTPLLRSSCFSIILALFAYESATSLWYDKKKTWIKIFWEFKIRKTNRFNFILLFVDGRHGDRREFSHVFGVFGDHDFLGCICGRHCCLGVQTLEWIIAWIFQSPSNNEMHLALRVVFIVEQQSASEEITKINTQYGKWFTRTCFLHLNLCCRSIPSGLLRWTVSSGSQVILCACLLPSTTLAPSLLRRGSFSITQSAN